MPRSLFMNVNSLQYTSFMMADALREGRVLGVPGANGNQLVPLDAQGHPTADFEILWIADGFEFAAGTYGIEVVGLFDSLSWFGANPAPTVANQSYNPATNRTTATVTFAPGQLGTTTLGFHGTRRNPQAPAGSGLAEWHLYRPIALDSPTPHPSGSLISLPMGQMLAPLPGIRALDTALTNNDAYAMAALSQVFGPLGGPSPADQYQMPWADRRSPNDPLQAGPGAKGVAVEIIVALANQSGGGGLWFPMYDYASDEYVDNFYYAIRYGTDGVLPYTGPPGSAVVNPHTGAANPQPADASGNPAPAWAPLRGPLIVEPGNEMWNFGFTQYGRNLRLAQLEVRSGPSDLSWDGTLPDGGGAFTIAARRVGRRAKFLSDRGKAILGAAAFGTTFFPTLMGQQGGPGYAQGAIAYIVNQVGAANVNTVLTHVGCGWYDNYNVPNNVNAGALTTAQIIGCGLQPMNEPASHVGLCKTYGVRFAAYEGGANVAVPGATQDTWTAVNSDPQTWRYARAVVDAAFATDPIVDVLCAFEDTAGGWALMGSTYDLTSAAAGKYRALVAAQGAWTANPANGASADPMPPLATVTAVTVSSPAATVAAGGTATLTATVVGTNGPLDLVGWYADAGAAPGGAFVAPPPANVDRRVVVSAFALFDPAVVGSATIAVPAVPGAPPPVLDPSFEAVRVPPGGQGFVGAPGGTPWAFAGAAGLTAEGQGYALGLGDSGCGTQYAFLQGAGSASQAIPGWPAGTYQVSLMGAQRPFSGNAANTLNVLVDGVVVGTFTPDPVDSSGNATHAWVAWTSPPFAVAAGAHTLTLAGAPATAADVTILVDNVALLAAGSPPPAPAAPATVRQLLQRLHVAR